MTVMLLFSPPLMLSKNQLNDTLSSVCLFMTTLSKSLTFNLLASNTCTKSETMDIPNPTLNHGLPQPCLRLFDLPQEVQNNIYNMCLETAHFILRGRPKAFDSGGYGLFRQSPVPLQSYVYTLTSPQTSSLELVCRKMHEDVRKLRLSHCLITPAYSPNMPWTFVETHDKLEWLRSRITSLEIRRLGDFRHYPSPPQLQKMIMACLRVRYIHLDFLYTRRTVTDGNAMTYIQNELMKEENIALKHTEFVEISSLTSYLSKRFGLHWKLTVEVTTEWFFYRATTLNDVCRVRTSSC